MKRGALDRNRTGTRLLETDFKSAASTNSATRAFTFSKKLDPRMRGDDRFLITRASQRNLVDSATRAQERQIMRMFCK